MNRKRKLMAIPAGLAVWTALLLALTAAERGQPGAGIHTVWDAAWYAIVTLTTAGYGDLVPVTPAGKLIGVLLMLMSVGLWAAMIGAVWALLRNSLLPAWRLRRIARRPWAVLSDRSEASEALAADLRERDPAVRVVFCGSADRRESRSPRTLAVPMDVRALMNLPAAGKGLRTVFLMDADGWQNAAAAEALAGRCDALYCRGEEAASIPGARCFDPAALCARQYWLGHPADPRETVFLLCGDGKTAQALLCEGLLACCREPFAVTEFHVFGDWADFRRMHPELTTVRFHEEAWNADRDFLERADRILLAEDDGRENAERAAALARAFAVRGEVHAATALPAACDARFGAVAQVFTAELVTRQALDRMAMTMHQTFGKLSGGAPPWETLSPFLKDSNRAAADHLLTKLRLLLPEEDIREVTPATCARAASCWAALSASEREDCRRNEHARWLLFHTLHNWRWGAERDNRGRLHPCMVPYDDLSGADKAKDDSAWEIIGAIAGEVKP